MAQFNRVMDYLKGMPDNQNHREMYFDKFITHEANGKMKDVDMLELEKQAIGPGERNILRNLNTQVKFTKKDFDKGFKLNVLSSYYANEESRHVESNERSYVLSFTSSLKWWLLPASVRVSYSTRLDNIMEADRELRSEILSACRNMSGPDTANLNLVSTAEKLSLESNMEHIFTKMYLILQDYNLASTSKYETRMADESVSYRIMEHITAQARLATIMDNDIVVDSAGFTPQELGLLGLAANEYPKVWYAGDNIYNSCQMDSDNLVIISEKGINIDRTFAFGSPDSLYRIICSLACKLDSVSCMMTAFSNMRGKAKMMHDMCSMLGELEVSSGMPLSLNFKRALGGPNVYAAAQSKTCGYMSTSIGLVADMLLGMQFQASASCVVEELGGYGDQLCGKTPTTNRTFNGLARDYGLDNADVSVNILLLNWHSISGSPITWGLGQYPKEYVVKLAEYMQMGNEIEMPQIMHTIPFTHTPNTSWGYCRGWQGLGKPLYNTKDEISESHLKLAVFSWMVGLSEKRPETFRNKGKRNKRVNFSPDVNRLESKSNKGFVLKDIKMFLGETVGGRIDESERTADGLFKTEYVGTECALIYDRETDAWVKPQVTSPPDYEKLFRETVGGEVPRRDMTPVTLGGAPPIKRDAVERVKALGYGNKMTIHDRKMHVKSNSQGMAVTSPYKVDGEIEKMALLDNNPDIEEGSTISIDLIEVPGDGQCALHAVAEDLKAHGYLDQVQATQIQSNFNGQMSTSDFHDAQEVAGVVIKWGFGLDVYDEDDDGTVRLHRYGDKTVKHRITLLRKHNHFSAVKYKGKSTKVVNRVEETGSNNEELLKNIEKFKKFFNLK